MIPESAQKGLLEPQQIAGDIRRRMDPNEYLNIDPALREKYEQSGWVLHKSLKKTSKMRREKPHDIAFEDRVWSIFARLGFPLLNQGRLFRVPYGTLANEKKQVDIFASDEDTVFIVECKSSVKPTRGALKAEVEAIRGIRDGTVKTLKQWFPDKKIQFVLATNNYVLSPEVKQRIDQAGLVHLDEDAVDYYHDLASHLGRAAKYQLLGNLLSGSKIPNIDATIPAIRGSMGGHTYFSFSIEPERLLRIGYILHRNRAHANTMPAYQRLIKKSRLKKVTQFIESGGFFPNSIIVNLDMRGKSPRFDRLGKIDESGQLGLLHLPQTYRTAFIIDGQHRLYGYSDSNRSQSDQIPVVAFVDMLQEQQVQIFMDINENQQSVPKNLRNTLNAELLWTSADKREQAKALRLRIAQGLEDTKTSPLHGRIQLGEEKKTVHRCLTIEAIARGLERGSFIGTFDKTSTVHAGLMHKGDNESTYALVMPFLESCFSYLRDELPTQWTLGSAVGGFVFINTGVEAVLRLLSDIVDYLQNVEKLNVLSMAAADIFGAVEPFLEPAVLYINSRSEEEGREFRSRYGSAGPIRLWRALQLAINERFPDFDPDGMKEFARDEARAYNTQSFNIIRDIETLLREDIRQRLQSKHGQRWLKDGLPKQVYVDASRMAAEKNMELDEENEVTPWECLHLIDYQKIMQTSNAEWVELFADRYGRQEVGSTSSGWKSKSSWLTELNRIRNVNFHEYSVSEEEFAFLVGLAEWLDIPVAS